jgi:hypothetical protein
MTVMPARWTSNAPGACVLLALITIAATSCAVSRDDPSTRARVHVVTNGAIPDADVLPVRFQPFDEPQLDQLATR